MKRRFLLWFGPKRRSRRVSLARRKEPCLFPLKHRRQLHQRVPMVHHLDLSRTQQIILLLRAGMVLHGQNRNCRVSSERMKNPAGHSRKKTFQCKINGMDPAQGQLFRASGVRASDVSRAIVAAAKTSPRSARLRLWTRQLGLKRKQLCRDTSAIVGPACHPCSQSIQIDLGKTAETGAKVSMLVEDGLCCIAAAHGYGSPFWNL